MTATYESQYLALCQKYEGLRRECPCDSMGGRPSAWKCSACIVESTPHSNACLACHGRRWLPLPEAERLGALVQVAQNQLLLVMLHPVTGCELWRVTDGYSYFQAEGFGPKHWQSLSAALTAALTAASEA